MSMIQSYWQHLQNQYEKMLSEHKNILLQAKITRKTPTQLWYIYFLDAFQEDILLAQYDNGLLGKLEGVMVPESLLHSANELGIDVQLEAIRLLEDESEWQKIRFLRVYDEEHPEYNEHADFLHVFTEDAYIRSHSLNATYLQTKDKGKFVSDNQEFSFELL